MGLRSARDAGGYARHAIPVVACDEGGSGDGSGGSGGRGAVVGVSGCLRVLVGVTCVKCAFGVLRIFDT